jgi:hypothetical protein
MTGKSGWALGKIFMRGRIMMEVRKSTQWAEWRMPDLPQKRGGQRGYLFSVIRYLEGGFFCSGGPPAVGIEPFATFVPATPKSFGVGGSFCFYSGGFEQKITK